MMVVKIICGLFVLLGSLGFICHVMARIKDGEPVNIGGIVYCMTAVMLGIVGLIS